MDFVYKGFDIPGNTQIEVHRFPALKSQHTRYGVSIDYAPFGVKS